jgi:hypothetical protein
MNERTNEIPNSSSVTLELSIVAGGFWFSESSFRDFPKEEGRKGGRNGGEEFCDAASGRLENHKTV